MSKSLPLLLLFTLLSLSSISQTKTEIQKECRITGGLGFAGATQNTVSVGLYSWLQLDYKFSKNISIATEFENMGYKLPGYFSELPADLNKQTCADNNFSLLFKYHIFIKSPLKVALASGWTYTIRSSSYYIHEGVDSTSYHTYLSTRTYDDFEIPLLAELEYPLWKTVSLQARAKYNVNLHNANTYSTGIGLSLKL